MSIEDSLQSSRMARKVTTHAAAPSSGSKHVANSQKPPSWSTDKHVRHALAHRQRLAADLVPPLQSGALGDVAEREQELLQGDVRLRLLALDDGRDDPGLVQLALHARQLLEALGARL